MTVLREATSRASFYTLRAEARDEGANSAELFLYSVIGESWWEETVAAKDLVRELAELDVAKIDVRINSPGGQVADGVAIFNALKRHPARVTAHVDGIAASIASVIALAADEVIMGEASMMMIHEPHGGALGTSADMRSYAEHLDKIRVTMIDVYAARSTMTAGEVEAAMHEETWYTASEAVEIGFASSVDAGRGQIAATARFDARALARFEHVPDRVAAQLRDVTTPSAPSTPLPTPPKPQPVPLPDAALAASSDPSNVAWDGEHARRVRTLLATR